MKIIISTIILFSVILELSNCSKRNDPSMENVIFNLSSNADPSLVADGSTIVNVSCNLGSDATPDRRNILFTTSGGKFIATKDTSSLSQKAIFINNTLIATVQLIVPQSKSLLKITAQPDIPDLRNNNYILPLSITIKSSDPAHVKLNANTGILASNFGSEATINGILTNVSGGKVSFGNKVVFEDYLVNGQLAKGTFRSTVDTTGVSSTVSTFYSNGNVLPNSKILITATVLSGGVKTAISDTLNFYINK